MHEQGGNLNDVHVIQQQLRGWNFFSQVYFHFHIYCGWGLRFLGIGCLANGAEACGAGPSGFFQVGALFIGEEE